MTFFSYDEARLILAERMLPTIMAMRVASGERVGARDLPAAWSGLGPCFRLGPNRLEAANGPTTFEADQIRNDPGITVVPDILAIAGRVAVAYLEWVQDPQAYFWSEREVDERLRQIMQRAFTAAAELAHERGLSLRQAAPCLGEGRVSQAHVDRGLFP